jgi:tRNA(Ile2) C34 agmatinyltransferase TiaS
MQVMMSSQVISGILNCVCPDCGGSMGGGGKEFTCRGKCQTDWRPLWEQVLSAGFHSQSRKRSQSVN